MSPSSESPRQCPSCGATAIGYFCPACGTSLGGGQCRACGAVLVVGSRFCSDCGAAVGGSSEGPTTRRAAAATRGTSRVAGVVAGLAALGIIASVAFRIGSRPPPSGTGALVETGAVPQGAVAAPDISKLSPREQASRLYDRVMRLHEERKTDSIAFFAPMALGAYAAIPDLDLDARYDMSRIAMIAGALPLARAQDDTILRRDSTHLLGLLLGADLARAANDEARAKKLESTFAASVARERKRNLPEYEAHGAEIESALKRLGAAKR
jgi:hypothetical protein